MNFTIIVEDPVVSESVKDNTSLSISKNNVSKDRYFLLILVISVLIHLLIFWGLDQQASQLKIDSENSRQPEIAVVQARLVIMPAPVVRSSVPEIVNEVEPVVPPEETIDVVEEIAEVMGFTRTAIGTRISRIKEKLKKQLVKS